MMPRRNVPFRSNNGLMKFGIKKKQHVDTFVLLQTLRLCKVKGSCEFAVYKEDQEDKTS